MQTRIMGNVFGNGRPTVRSKTHLAATAVGGIMIWELGQDRFDHIRCYTPSIRPMLEVGVTTTLHPLSEYHQ